MAPPIAVRFSGVSVDPRKNVASARAGEGHRTAAARRTQKAETRRRTFRVPEAFSIPIIVSAARD
jgi:hypothetical protein